MPFELRQAIFFQLDAVIRVEVVEPDNVDSAVQQAFRQVKPMNPAAPVTRTF